MMIKDLSRSKELDRKALAEVRGGGQQIGSQTVATSVVSQEDLYGVQLSLNDTTANSVIAASNFEDNSTHFGGFTPWFF
jgi:hypothetical protein